jgi:short-subunit dehydrogenase
MLAVVTGASSGIGAVFARKLASKGYDLLLTARREDRLRSLAEELHSLYHIKAEALRADLAVDVDRNRLAARIRASPDLGLLVNNAGFGIMGYFSESPVGRQEEMHRVHILTAMNLTHAALGNLIPRAQAGTGIINVSSVAAFGTSPGSVTYAASKTWMNAFTQGLAMELGAQGSPVKVQALCPGFTLSEFHDVVKMDRSRIPSSLWLTADFVVEESLRTFGGSKVVVIPHWRYKAIATFMRVMPEPLMRRISVAMARRYRKPQMTDH